MMVSQTALDNQGNSLCSSKTSASLAQVEETLPLATETLRFDIEGAHCASCAAKVDAVLTKLDSVSASHLNLANNTFQVDFHSDRANASEVIKQLGASGYQASLIETQARQTTAQDDSLKQARHRAMLAVALALPVFVTEMGGHLYAPIHHFLAQTIGQTPLHWMQFVLCSAVLLLPGREMILSGLKHLSKGQPEMNSLVALGTLSAWAYSTLVLLVPSIFPEGTQFVYFEAAAVIVALILLGRWMETRAKSRAGAAIETLLNRLPDTALKVLGDKVTEVPLVEVRVGDILRARAGDRIAVDGVVIRGHSHIDESMISGEPVPVEKSAEDTVVGGTLNGPGLLDYRATHIGKDMMISRIVALVEKAQADKLPIQSLADRVVAIFVPAVLALALLSFAAWLVFAPAPALPLALVAAVSVIIIACPCAMGLATPMSIMVGSGRAAELGVFFRNGSALQSLSRVKTVVFDKTGTLTVGQPSVVRHASVADMPIERCLRLMASAQRHSSHPLSAAFQQAADVANITDTYAPETVQTLAGLGLEAEIDGNPYLIGSAALMRARGIDVSPLQEVVDEATTAGETLVFLADATRVLACFGLTDPLKPEAEQVVKSLHNAGLNTVILSGDQPEAAEHVALKLGITDVHAGVLPEDKAAHVAALSGDGVAFVGDGINDAPALAAADVGIAVGSGTDVAIDSADVVLTSGNLTGLLNANTTARKTLMNIKQNLFWAFGYNVLLLPIAAGALYPFLGWQLSPMLAAGAMALSSVFVVTNALRLRRIRGVSL